MQFIEGYERKVLQVNWSKTTCVTMYYYTKGVKFIAKTSDCKKHNSKCKYMLIFF